MVAGIVIPPLSLPSSYPPAPFTGFDSTLGYPGEGPSDFCMEYQDTGRCEEGIDCLACHLTDPNKLSYAIRDILRKRAPSMGINV